MAITHDARVLMRRRQRRRSAEHGVYGPEVNVDTGPDAHGPAGRDHNDLAVGELGRPVGVGEVPQTEDRRVARVRARLRRSPCRSRSRDAGDGP